MSIEARPKEYRVNHPMYRSYIDFLRDLKSSFLDVPRLFVQKTTFKNQASLLKTFKGVRGLRSEVVQNDDVAYVPFWIDPNQFNVKMEEAMYGTAMLFNSLLHSEDDRAQLVKRIIGIAPYIEVREDKDGSGVDGDRDAGEAIDAEIIGRELAVQGLNGQKLVWLSPHSYEAYKMISRPVIPIPEKKPYKMSVEVLPISSAPLFAQKVKDANLVSENTVIVSLDKGSLQQCVHFVDLLGLDVKTNLVAFDKKRKGHNQVKDLSMIYGNPEMFKGKDVIIYDDLIDTFGSMKSTCEALKDLGCRTITIIATHGVLSYPARDNILDAIATGIVNKVMMTDSLPYASDYFEDLKEHVEIVNVAKLLGVFAQLFSVSSVEDLRRDPTLSPYIVIPEDKERYWRSFKKRV